MFSKDHVPKDESKDLLMIEKAISEFKSDKSSKLLILNYKYIGLLMRITGVVNKQKITPGDVYVPRLIEYWQEIDNIPFIWSSHVTSYAIAKGI